MLLLSESESLAVRMAQSALQCFERKEKQVLTSILPLTYCVTRGEFPHLSVLKLAIIYKALCIHHGIKTELE